MRPSNTRTIVKKGDKRKKQPWIPRYNGEFIFFPRVGTSALKFDLFFTAPAATVLAPYSLNYFLPCQPQYCTTVAVNVPGFTSFAGLWRKYIPMDGNRFKYTLTNQEAFPVEMFVIPLNYSPVGLITDPRPYLSYPGAKTLTVSAKGGVDRGTLTLYINRRQFTGFLPTQVEDNFTGLTSGSMAASAPADQYYIMYGFITNGVATVAGLSNKIRNQFCLDFAEPQLPVN